jgi:superfamily II DNA/RNA helicase
LAVYGGKNMQEQIAALNKGVDIIVGTPGRIKDLLERKALNFDSIEIVCLDEADEMLNIGFK